MRKTSFLVAVLAFIFHGKGQDTFSILAYDSITREVGAAGASCVNLFQTPYSDHFIAELFPDSGAVVTQAAYQPLNQANARSRFRAGYTPAQLINWLDSNDLQSNSAIRQYGVVRFGYAAAAHTGTGCTEYKNHITGRNYSIQGNILLGQIVLDSMEARFQRAEGDLACRLMAAMQGAKMVGADTRCAGNNSSSLFAFIKVTKPGDTFGWPSFLVSVRTQPGDSIEPVDSLQVLFDAQRICEVSNTGLPVSRQLQLPRIYPNPAMNAVLVDGGGKGRVELRVYDASGRLFAEESFYGSKTMNMESWPRGLYFFELLYEGRRLGRRVIVD